MFWPCSMLLWVFSKKIMLMEICHPNWWPRSRCSNHHEIWWSLFPSTIVEIITPTHLRRVWLMSRRTTYRVGLGKCSSRRWLLPSYWENGEGEEHKKEEQEKKKKSQGEGWRNRWLVSCNDDVSFPNCATEEGALEMLLKWESWNPGNFKNTHLSICGEQSGADFDIARRLKPGWYFGSNGLRFISLKSKCASTPSMSLSGVRFNNWYFAGLSLNFLPPDLAKRMIENAEFV